jgi:thymidylate synthase (FAD)
MEKRTEKGTRYVTDSEVFLIGQTNTNLSFEMWQALRALNPGFVSAEKDPVSIPDAPALIKFAGQLCYLSFTENRTTNAEAQKYLDNIKIQQHGSVLEHINFTILFMGIDRAVTHELVRHRAGMAYSQVSQRYVGPENLRFVKPVDLPESDSALAKFEKEIDQHQENYVSWCEEYAKYAKDLEGEKPRDKRKRMQSAARRCLPNCTEAPIVVTGNVRAWRHIFEKRLANSADAAIRRPMYKVFLLLREVAPMLFNDFTTVELPDGSLSASTKYPKV